MTRTTRSDHARRLTHPGQGCDGSLNWPRKAATLEALVERRHTFCRICEASCGLEVDVDAGRIVRIRPDKAHVGTRGFACNKGLHQHELYDSPDRLTRPMRRAQGAAEHQAVSWDAALGDIGARVREIHDRHGPDAIAMYVGTAAGFSLLHPIFAQGFMTALGSKSMYSSATQDCANKFAVSRWMYGFPFTLPYPDIERTKGLIIVGANPVVSKWSFLQVSNPTQRIKAIQARGGFVAVVDPRRTETAKLADTHLFIRPDRDVFFYLAFLSALIERDALDLERAHEYMRGHEQVLTIARAWTPERCAPETGIEAAALRELVDRYIAASREGGAALYCSTGVNMGRHGSLGYWLQEVINALSGNLDRAGGTLVGQGAIDFPKFGAKRGILMRNDRSRIGDYGSVNDAFPGGLLADEILTPGKGQVRALFVTGGNPLITMANAGRLREAFAKLDLLVTLDIFPNETGALSHYMLPCTSPLERADLPFIFPFLLGMQSRPYLQATRAVVPAPGEARDEATIYLDLCKASGFPLFGSRIAQRGLELMRWRNGRRLPPGAQPSLPQERLLSGLLRLAGQGSFDKLHDQPHGRAGSEPELGSFLPARVHTPDKRVDLAPEPLLAALQTLLDARESQRVGERKRPFSLITKRHVNTHNSWTHNAERFVGAPGEGRDTNYLFMHGKDVAELGLEDGALVDVESETATVRLPLRVHDDLMPGVVALPHGWGHQHARGMTVASRTRGVNVNLLAADGPSALERESGMAHLTGIPVDVRPAAGPRDVESWSGRPEERWAGFTSVER